MKVYRNKGYFAVGFKNGFCIGLGRAPPWMKDAADRTRRHFGI